MSTRDPGATPAGRLRLVLVFDALFPVTKGGAERWFGALANELAAAGHQVTYLTAGRGELPADLPFEVREVMRGRHLYGADGSRRLLPSILFGLASGWWLLRHRRRLDAVYVHQTPLFTVLAARLALGRRVPWVVEWIEWWSRAYWQDYAPGLVGWVGWLVQRAALKATPRATVFARSTESRLRSTRPDLSVAFMPGQVLDLEETAARPAEVSGDVPLVLIVGRLVPEKHVDAAIAAIADLARARPIRARVIGQGPLLGLLRAQAARSGADIDVLGPVSQNVLEASYGEAAVLVHPSEREGFGLVVVEAAARGVPVVIVDGPDNAAVELVTPGTNGMISPSRRPEDLGLAIAQVLDGGLALRWRTRSWFEEAATTRSVHQTAAAVVALFTSDSQAGRAR